MRTRSPAAPHIAATIWSLRTRRRLTRDPIRPFGAMPSEFSAERIGARCRSADDTPKAPAERLGVRPHRRASRRPSTGARGSCEPGVASDPGPRPRREPTGRTRRRARRLPGGGGRRDARSRLSGHVRDARGRRPRGRVRPHLRSLRRRTERLGNRRGAGRTERDPLPGRSEPACDQSHATAPGAARHRLRPPVQRAHCHTQTVVL